MLLSPHIPVPLGLRALRKRAGVNPLIINYHMVSDRQLPYITNLYKYRSVDGFVRDLDFYVKHYQPIGMSEFMASLQGDLVLPENALMLTFDDGFREMHEVAAPILLDKKIPATFFLIRDFVDNLSLNHDNKQSLIAAQIVTGIPSGVEATINELLHRNKLAGKELRKRIIRIPYKQRKLVDQIADLLGLDFEKFLEQEKPYMTTKQISELINNGFSMGGHSEDHARFSELTLEEQVSQVRNSMDFVVEKFPIDYRVFAFPYSDRGASSALFKAISGDVDVSFGTHGLLEDPVPNHFQRISVEKHTQSALKTIKFHYARRYIYNILGKQLIVRGEY